MITQQNIKDKFESVKGSFKSLFSRVQNDEKVNPFNQADGRIDAAADTDYDIEADEDLEFEEDSGSGQESRYS